MKRIQIEFISSGFREILCSQGVSDEVQKAANKIATQAAASSKTYYNLKPEYKVKGPKMGGYGGGRIIAHVAADNGSAIRAALYDHVLEKVIWEV